MLWSGAAVLLVPAQHGGLHQAGRGYLRLHGQQTDQPAQGEQQELSPRPGTGQYTVNKPMCEMSIVKIH